MFLMGTLCLPPTIISTFFLKSNPILTYNTVYLLRYFIPLYKLLTVILNFIGVHARVCLNILFWEISNKQLWKECFSEFLCTITLLQKSFTHGQFYFKYIPTSLLAQIILNQIQYTIFHLQIFRMNL